MALGIRKIVLEKLIFPKFKSEFLDLAKFDFWDLINFAMVERIAIFLPILSLPLLLTLPGIL